MRHLWLVLLLMCVSLPADAGSAIDTLHSAVGKLECVHSVRADIDQELEQLQLTRHFHGTYVAAAGKYRIEFSEPRGQTIVHDGERLRWYIEREQTVWESEPVVKTDAKATRPATLSYDPSAMVGMTASGFSYQAFHESTLFGLLGKSIRFVLTPESERKDLSRLEIVVDEKTETIRTVDIYDVTGAIAARQTFGKYVTQDDCGWPGVVEVQIWSPLGVTRSATRYRNAVLNGEVDGATFALELPEGTKHEKLAGAVP